MIDTKRATSGPKMVPLPHEYKELSTDLAENEKWFREQFANTTDIVFREFYMGEIRCLGIWVDGLINGRISLDVFHSMMLDASLEGVHKAQPQERANYVEHHILPFYAVLQVQDLIELRRWVMMAKMALLIEGSSIALVLDAESTPARSISEPVLESVVMGPRDAFVEVLRINTALVRTRLGDPQLKTENYIIGRRSNTLVTLMFIEDLADPAVIQEVRRRLTRIDRDMILDTAPVTESIQDRPFSLFPILKHTERPDKVVADLTEGRFALFVDGTPLVITGPSVFVEFMQTAEDYYINPIIATSIRFLRYLSLFFATALPAIYVAITSFHVEMLPIPLVFSVAGARELVPFPAFVESLILLLVFEILVEAGIRLPRVVGGAVNIVGALILGQAAVQAGLISPILVIIIAGTAISNFVLGSGYELSTAVRVIRIFALTASAVFGLYGLTLVIIAVLIHMAGLRSFGVPYLAPWAPFDLAGMKDVIYRTPWWSMEQRPDFISNRNVERDKTPEPNDAGMPDDRASIRDRKKG
ncbi:MAG: spore germination protein [Acidobacteriota bacterium]